MTIQQLTQGAGERALAPFALYAGRSRLALKHLGVVKRPRFFRPGSTVTSITNISRALALVVPSSQSFFGSSHGSMTTAK